MILILNFYDELQQIKFDKTEIDDIILYIYLYVITTADKDNF